MIHNKGNHQIKILKIILMIFLLIPAAATTSFELSDPTVTYPYIDLHSVTVTPYTINMTGIFAPSDIEAYFGELQRSDYLRLSIYIKILIDLDNNIETGETFWIATKDQVDVTPESITLSFITLDSSYVVPGIDAMAEFYYNLFVLPSILYSSKYIYI